MKVLLSMLMVLGSLLLSGCNDTTNGDDNDIIITDSNVTVNGDGGCCTTTPQQNDECEGVCEGDRILNNEYDVNVTFVAEELNASYIYPQELTEFKLYVPEDQRHVIFDECKLIKKHDCGVELRDFHIEICGELWSCLHNFSVDEKEIVIPFVGPSQGLPLKISSGNSNTVKLMAYTVEGSPIDVSEHYELTCTTSTDSELSEDSEGVFPIDINLTIKVE